MSSTSRQEELAGGQRGAQVPARREEPGLSPAGLIVWVVTRKLDHDDTTLLGVRGSQERAAHLIEDDITEQDFPTGVVVRYYSESHIVT